MRIRSTKPEFWKSRRITSVSWDARLVLKGLESYVDDNGVGIDDIELIVTDVFPRDMFANGSETVARVSEAITELHQAGLVWRYASETDHLLYISFWEGIQRIDKPGKGRNPRPDGTLEYRDSSIRESVANVPETLAPGTGEQGNRGTEEQGSRGAEEQLSSSDADASDADEFQPEIYDLCNTLADAVRANGHTVNTVGKTWWQACERLMRIDGYTHEQIEWMIRWSTSDEFWAANIQSMPTLRKKFSQMKLQATRNKQPASQKPTPTDRVAAILALGNEQEGIEQ